MKKLLFILLLFFIPCVVQADVAVTLEWDANSEDDLAGYKLFWGLIPGNYMRSVDVGNVTRFTLAPMDNNTKYYFAAKAYDKSDNESDFSSEVEYTTPGMDAPDIVPPTKVGGLRIKATVILEIEQ